MFDWIDNYIQAIIILIIMSFIINKAADKLGDALRALAYKLKIPNTVRGAIFDAASSSFPEFSTAMIAVLIYKDFGNIAIPTIAGSGMFNILLIPMLSILAYKGKDRLKAQKNGIYRDMFFYTASILTLCFFTYMGELTVFAGMILVCIYVCYIMVLYIETISYRKKIRGYMFREENDIDDCCQMNHFQIIMTIFITSIIIWISCEAIIKCALVISNIFNIPKFLVSVIILAACTSIPDTLLSVKSARKGDVDGAISNAVGSNIFNICMCLGVPIVASGKNLSISLGQSLVTYEFLLVAMVVTSCIFLKKEGIDKKDGYLMLIVYVIFLVYVTAVAYNLIPMHL
ncbi:cation:H+ antiporter [Alkalithermobacter thermoalcaliphilus JW-YL-7 = DSM 7308]|uniref:Cation:H+ antiporter n=1 Tax=Alkalithermobacter thermoalcaliphilus JW-YL-7 = DSM 7308 TaxID=1121328 RepID=A0A150FR57_CLOPD|nr:sodium/calcium exchanger membrane region [[Clostridium] paradoxum JW-YL-7 = DSM 7308]SHL01945.1 cation:H+ antiporter [[Clostridium] paradoxum JW-YL-7 = DSM 7308]